MEYRTCTKCHLEKDIEEFHWRNKKLGTRHAECKGCFGKRVAKWQSDNQDRFKEGVRSWQADHPGATGRWQVNHPEEARAVKRAAKHRRRARLRKVESENFKDIEIFERDGWICQLCGEPIDRTLCWPDLGSVSLDHIVPVSKQGAHTRKNTQAAHLGCNVRKGAKSEWRPSMSKLAISS